MRISSSGNIGETVNWLQWSRFKRREKSVLFLVWTSLALHLVFWLTWHFFIAPYPTALSLPIGFALPVWMAGITDYLWPLANTALLAVNIWLIFYLYKKDIFASWLVIGGNLFIQFLVLSVTFYLASFSSPL